MSLNHTVQRLNKFFNAEILSEKSDKILEFVTRVENDTIERVRAAGGNGGNIPSYGKEMGKLYQQEYAHLKEELTKTIDVKTFDSIFERHMTAGQMWEYFYPNFMKGLS